MIAIRCSELPRALVCPASLGEDGGDGQAIEPVTEASNLGTAAHEALQTVALTGSPDWDSIDEIASRHGVKSVDVRVLAAQGAKLWAAVREDFLGATIEAPMRAMLADGVELTGHADIVALARRTGRIADWKTGRVDHSYREQLIGYAALLLLDDPTLEQATATILWVRDGEAEHYTLRRSELEAWRARVVATVTERPAPFRPGDHCTFCPFVATCDAARGMARRDIAVFMGDDVASVDVSALTPTQQVELYDRASRVEKLAASVKAAIRAHVDANGPVAAPEGALVMQVTRPRELDATKAWGVLTDAGFTDEDFAAVMDLSVSRIESLIAQRAERGKGAAAVRDIAAKLEAAGAVITTERKTITRKRA